VSPNGYRVLSPSSAEEKNERNFNSTPPIRCQGVDRGNFAFELNYLLFEAMEQFFLEDNIMHVLKKLIPLC
jgi:hypothetical protein